MLANAFSSDKTVDLARDLGAHVVQHTFVARGQQFSWSLDNLAVETEWVMRLEADEALTPERVEKIGRRLPGLPPDVVDLNLKHRHILYGVGSGGSGAL